MLEAREEEERLQATATEIDLQTKAKEAVSRRIWVEMPGWEA